jgi:hypothetical protein
MMEGAEEAGMKAERDGFARNRPAQLALFFTVPASFS